jgi:Tol biopolymer transport system component
VPDAELPAEPLAISYRTPQEARERAEAQQPREGVSAGEGPTLVGKVNVHADVDALERYLADVFGADRSVPEAHLGRLALLDARSGDVTFVEGARRGAVPQAWSADRRTLLFAQPTAPERADVQIFEWSASEGTLRRVTVGPPIHSQACYGPDARIVATAVEVDARGTRTRIRISGPNGRAPYTDLSAGPADHSPSCAPDGSAVAFAHAPDAAHSEIWLVRAPFADPPHVLAPGRAPRFSREGWIVYAAPAGRASRIFRIRADGSGRAPVGAGATDEAWPSASPDGRLVAYVAREPEALTRLLVRRLDGSGDRILLASGEGEHPVW